MLFYTTYYQHNASTAKKQKLCVTQSHSVDIKRSRKDIEISFFKNLKFDNSIELKKCENMKI